MRDEQITGFDPIVEETEKMMDLWGTVQEAATQINSVSAAQKKELQDLILQAVESLGEKAGILFQAEKKHKELAGEHRAALSVAFRTEGLLEAVQAWQISFATLLNQHFFDRLRGCLQLSAAAAERTVAMAENVFPLNQNSRGIILLELALRCGITAPDLSARTMLRAFELVPDLLKDKGDHLKGFVYQPEQHPQREFHCCPVCGGTGTAYRTACSCYILSYNPMFLPAKLWMRCQDCGTLYTRWFPEEFLALGQEPRLVYPREDRIAVQDASGALLRSWNEILNDAQALAQGSGRNLLEVGVGKGHLIAVAREMGYQVTAVEIVEQAAQETADLLECPILCGDFLKISEEQRFDVITMGDVLEHLKDPAEGLRKAYRLLREGGVLWLSTPNYESAFSRLRKMEDPMWRTPTHITYFSKKSLTSLVEQTGFQVKRYSVSSHYNGSMEMLLQKV